MMKPIYRPSSVLEADELRALLRQHGIESALENENSAQWNYNSVTAPLTIMVADGDEQKAIRVVQEHFDRLREKPPQLLGAFERGLLFRRSERRSILVLFYVIIGLIFSGVAVISGPGIVRKSSIVLGIVLLVLLLAAFFRKHVATQAPSLTKPRSK
jgi:hypothetical protein